MVPVVLAVVLRGFLNVVASGGLVSVIVVIVVIVVLSVESVVNRGVGDLVASVIRGRCKVFVSRLVVCMTCVRGALWGR